MQRVIMAQAKSDMHAVIPAKSRIAGHVAEGIDLDQKADDGDDDHHEEAQGVEQESEGDHHLPRHGPGHGPLGRGGHPPVARQEKHGGGKRTETAAMDIPAAHLGRLRKNTMMSPKAINGRSEAAPAAQRLAGEGRPRSVESVSSSVLRSSFSHPEGQSMRQASDSMQPASTVPVLR